MHVFNMQYYELYLRIYPINIKLVIPVTHDILGEYHKISESLYAHVMMWVNSHVGLVLSFFDTIQVFIISTSHLFDIRRDGM